MYLKQFEVLSIMDNSTPSTSTMMSPPKKRSIDLGHLSSNEKQCILNMYKQQLRDEPDKKINMIVFEISKTLGSTMPPKTEGNWRLYSMAYCPYAQRARITLKLKEVPHDIVNIDLKNKPEWFLKVSPTGKVPLLDTGSQVITESLDICDFINEKYLNPPLYDQERKEEDKKLIESFSPLIGLYSQAVYHKNDKSLNQHLEDMKPHLKALDDELKKRGKFFGGNEPKMPDYMLWPWAERSPILGMIYGEKIPLEELDIPNLLAWAKDMKQQKVCQELLSDLQLHYKMALHYRNGETFSYDNL